MRLAALDALGTMTCMDCQCAAGLRFAQCSAGPGWRGLSRIACTAVLLLLSRAGPGQPAIQSAHDPSRNLPEAAPRLMLDTQLPPAANPVSAAVPRPPQRRESLQALAADAAQSLPVIRAAAARARGDQERVAQARAPLRPNLAGSANLRQEFESSGATAPFRSAGGGVQLTVPLYRPQLSAAVDTAQFQFESTSTAQFETVRDLLAALGSAYVTAAQLEAETDSLAAERDVLLAQRDLNQKRMNGGAGTLVEVLETAARAELIQGQVRGAEGAEQLQLAEVSRLAGRAVHRVKRLAPDEAVPPAVPVSLPATAAAALALAQQDNATLRRLRLTADGARVNVYAQQAASSPALDLVGSLDRVTLESRGVQSQVPSALLGLRLTIPLADGGLIGARVGEARAGQERAEADLQDAELTLAADVAKAYADLGRAQAQLQANRAALAIGATSLRATVKAFQAGVRGNIDVLNAQQQAFTGQREVKRAQAALLLAQIRILALTGLLSVETLGRLEQALSN